MYKLREERNIKPSTFGQLVSSTLYEKRYNSGPEVGFSCCAASTILAISDQAHNIRTCRFGPYFCSPVIAGLEQDGKAYLCGMDSIGAIETAHDFMVAGTAPDSLYGMCESMWRPDLVSTGSNALLLLLN